MPNQFRFPDEERSLVQDKINEFVQNSDYMQNLNSKKRKRGSADDSSGDDPGAKRGSVNVNTNGNHVNGSMDSFGDALNSSASNDYSNLSQLRHAGTSTHEASTTAHAALLAAQFANPQNPNMSFTSNGSGTDGERVDSSFDTNGAESSQTHLSQGTGYQVPSYASLGSTAAQVQAAREASNGGGVKPQVGTEEWHKIRKDNHKEVERRRRETINEGINELAKIVPNCEKNKGSILASAVNYIIQLKTEKEKLVQNHTMEKVVTETAINELSQHNAGYKEELKMVWAKNKSLEAEIDNLRARRKNTTIGMEDDMNGDGEGSQSSSSGGSD
ncbi:basic helix-loop-helix protein [Varicellaria rhodocarpa]|nr:basic helix-loop-helix protein [Varicellaria rhodocarpa]